MILKIPNFQLWTGLVNRMSQLAFLRTGNCIFVLLAIKKIIERPNEERHYSVAYGPPQKPPYLGLL